MLDPLSRPPVQAVPLLRLLHERQVDWVLSGSAVLVLHGARLRPNDLDVVPALTPDNLKRLAGVLTELDAIPALHPAATLADPAAWTPDPPTAEQLDHLFVTTLGMVDVPPRLTGSYESLRPGATLVDLAGVPVWACAPEEVLDRLPAKPRAKDVERAAEYAAVRANLARTRTPDPDRLLAALA